MRREIQKLLSAQVALAVAAAGLMYFARGAHVECVVAALYGGAIAVVAAGLLALRTARVGRDVVASGSASPLGLVAGLVERFVFVLVAFGAGIGWLHLDPPSVIVGFAVPQLAFVMMRARVAGTPG
ncbi:MAG: hypothetical protein EPN72_05400 [Nevskiaceae bacterium]|nr:MAG: hypothetical protein EPN63_03795 [Nevskiaceae bacterium]TBR73572.1 MAG: hypothetical protein EPN72_05400 [Nevskiaceae bacterium]